MQPLIASVSPGVTVQFDPSLEEGHGMADGVLYVKGHPKALTSIGVPFSVIAETDAQARGLTKEQVMSAVQTALDEAQFQLTAHSVRLTVR